MKKRITIVLIGVIVVVLGRGFFYYNGFYTPPPGKAPSYEQVVTPMALSTNFSDTYEVGEGSVLIDFAHDNAFNLDELNVLILRLIARGLTIRFLETGDDLEKELLGEEAMEGDEEEKGEEELEKGSLEEDKGEEEQAEEELEEEFTAPNALIIVSPREEFSNEEKETISKFVENGGKLLLIADPARRSEVNSLSLDFGLVFEPDYLYNMKENDANFRNIFITEFVENEITLNLAKIALYIAGSISSTDSGIAFADENTFSSLIETREGLSPIALAEESTVLAISDLTFMTEPNNNILDNNQLIANIGDWLATPAEEEEEEQEESG